MSLPRALLLQKAVNCTRAQIDDGLALRKAYLLRSQQIIRRRQELSLQLHSADTQPGITTSQSGEVCTGGSCGTVGAAASASDISQDGLGWDTVLGGLHRQVRRCGPPVNSGAGQATQAAMDPEELLKLAMRRPPLKLCCSQGR